MIRWAKSIFPMLALCSFVWLTNALEVCGQHCPPIVESYLSSTRFARTDAGIELKLRYTKTGGRRKAAYQAYILAYSEKNQARVFELTPQEAISQKLVTIVHTQVTKQNNDGEYEIEFALNTQPFVDVMLKEKQLSVDSVLDVGGWKSFEHPIRLAVFIPFLADEEYARLPGLPEDKHECNYGQRPALLYDTLLPRLQICFGIVQAVRLEDGKYHIQIQSRQPR